MKIWFVNHYALPPGSSGGPTRHLGLARAMRDRGHDVTIIASIFDHYSRTDHRQRTRAPWFIEDIEGVAYVWISTPAYETTVKRIVNMASFAARVTRSSSRFPLEDPDVVVGSSPHLLAPLAARRIARSRGAGFIMEVRDVWPQSLIDLGELSARHPAIRLLGKLERWLYRQADEVITVLPYAQSHFLACGADPDHLHVVPNGTDFGAAVVRPDQQEGEVFTAVYAGTMGLANGLDLVIDAAEILRSRGRDDIRVRLIGAGTEFDGLATRSIGLPNVSVEPAVPADEVPSILATADVGLLILRDSPVFRWGISPTKLFDYMAAAIPVVMSVRTPSDPATEAGASIRADPGDPESLADALEHAECLGRTARESMGERGRTHALAQHSFAALAEKFEPMARAAAAAGRGRA